ncbi:MAG: GrdX family protein [Eubacteriales bacterium]|nr:GrdX family protein [Eubacteriales bacterium]MDD4540650.1 GrdX family protein [Eubacteriales bacterium]
MSKKAYIVVTNNPLVKEQLDETVGVCYFSEDSHRDLLERVRDFVHKGYRILTHPLAGSVKPWETPYRSVMITAKREEKTDLFSLEMIEQAIFALEKSKARPVTLNEKVLADFQIVDFSLIQSALPSAEAHGQH